MRSKYIWIGLSVAAAMAAVVVVVFAGDPDGPPGLPESTYSYTLEDIYRRLDNGAAGTPITFTEPISGPGTGTMHTLGEIMDISPEVDEANGAVQGDVLAGRTSWGLTGGAWGAMTGTMPDNGGVVIVPSTLTQAIAMGYHDGWGYVVGDADLVSGNVRGGVSLLGVSGDPNVVDTSSGDATAGEILTGKRAWVDGVEVIGTMPDVGAVAIMPTTTAQTIALGYHNGAGTVEGDPDLAAANIRCGVTIFGVVGTLPPECVAQTGQTQCYTTTTGSETSCPAVGYPGQDGEYQKGCLPVVEPIAAVSFGGYNRTSFTCSAGFTDNGNGTVTDNLTGLIWLKDASCSGLAGTDTAGRGNWTTALSAANGLANGTCGLTDGSSAGDWRLPNINEFRSLFDPGLGPSYLPAGHPFTDVKSYGYWSSTTDAGSTSSAWLVDSNAGIVYGADKTGTLHVWPVRGGQ